MGAGTAIAWHRFVLREERRAFADPNTLARYVVQGFVAVLPGAAIVLIGTPAIAILLRGLGDRAGATVITAVIILLAVAGAAVTVRLFLILPAVAIGDRSMTFRRSWAATRGYAARSCRLHHGPDPALVGHRPAGLGAAAPVVGCRPAGPGAGDIVFAVVAVSSGCCSPPSPRPCSPASCRSSISGCIWIRRIRRPSPDPSAGLSPVEDPA